MQKIALCLAFLLSMSPLGRPLLAQDNGTEEQAKPRILFLTQSKGFVHNPVKRGEATRSGAELAMMQLAKDSREFTVVCSQSCEADFTRERLQDFDIVALYTSGDLPIVEGEFDYFLKEWLPQKGHGLIGFHSASDTLKEFEPYWDLIGGTFNSHPWTANSLVTMKIHDPEHPAMKPFGSSYEIRDEIYQYDHWQPEKVHLLMSLDMAKTELKRPYHVPVAWCKQIGEGKMFYNNMGHRDETWQNEDFLNSIIGAVRWIAGKEQGNAEPNPAVSEAQHAESIKQAHAAGVTAESEASQQRPRRSNRSIGAADPDK